MRIVAPSCCGIIVSAAGVAPAPCPPPHPRPIPRSTHMPNLRPASISAGASSICVAAAAVADRDARKRRRPPIRAPGSRCSPADRRRGGCVRTIARAMVSATKVRCHAISMRTPRSARADPCGELELPVVLVGHSLGTNIVRRYADKHPADVAGIVLVDPPPQHVGEFSQDWVKTDNEMHEKVIGFASCCEKGASCGQLAKPPPELASCIRPGRSGLSAPAQCRDPRAEGKAAVLAHADFGIPDQHDAVRGAGVAEGIARLDAADRTRRGQRVRRCAARWQESDGSGPAADESQDPCDIDE